MSPPSSNLTGEQLSTLTTLNGSLGELGTLDLLQAIHDTKRSAALAIRFVDQLARVFFRNGDIIDAELGSLRGERALYAALCWTEGTFDLEFRELEIADAMRISTRRVLWEGRSWLDERARRMARLPDLNAVYVVDCTRLLEKLAELPDELNLVLKLFDGKRSLQAIVALSELDELSSLGALSRLLADAIIHDAAMQSRATRAGSAPPIAAPQQLAMRVGVRNTLDYHVPQLAELCEPQPTPSLRPNRPSTERTLRGLQAPGSAGSASDVPAQSAAVQAPVEIASSAAAERVAQHPDPPRRARTRRKRVSLEVGAIRRARTLGSSPELVAAEAEGSVSRVESARPGSELEPKRKPVTAAPTRRQQEGLTTWMRAVVAVALVALIGTLMAWLGRP